MTKIQLLIFISITFLGLFTRFYKLDLFPPSLNWDEISHSYNAYSLLTTGKDQWGISLPLFNFRAYGDFPTTLNLYLTVPFVAIFGVNVWSTRLPSAICSIIIVILSYLLSKYIFKNIYLGLMVMFLTAISPWIIFTGRAAYQSTVAQAFFLIGIWFLLSKKNPWGMFLLSLSMFGYHNTRIIAVPIALAYLLIIKPPSTFYRHYIPIIFSLFIAIISLLSLLSPDSRARQQWVGILNPAAINLINESRRLYPGPATLNRLINNKITYFIPTFTKNYLNLLNPIPLFTTGSKQYQYNVANTGLLYLSWLPFFYLGLIIVLRRLKYDPIYQFIFAWYLIGLIPSALTTGDFPTLRSFTIIPLPLICITLGLSLIIKIFKNNYLYLIFIAISLFELVNYTHKYKNFWINYSSSWQYGYQQVVDYLKINYSKYDHIYITKKYGEPHEFVLFYWPWNPRSFQNDSQKIWDYHAGWYWVDSFDKFKFINDWEIISTNFLPNSLLITSPGNYPSNTTKLDTIYFLDKSPSFDIVKL